MKKMFFALAALVLAFTGCSQEDEAIQTNEQKAVKVVVNMDKPGFGTNARAARTGWETGDEVVVTLAGQLTAYVKLTYQEDKTWETAFYKKGSIVNIVAKLKKLGILMRKKIKIF